MNSAQDKPLESWVINFKNYSHVKLENKLQLPKLPCVYLLFSGIKCLYVGQTRNLKDRWRRHQKLIGKAQNYSDLRIYWREIREHYTRRWAEWYLTKYFQPEFNPRWLPPALQGIDIADKNGNPHAVLYRH